MLRRLLTGAIAFSAAMAAMGPARADGEAIIVAGADATVSEARPDNLPSPRVAHILSAGVGQSPDPGRVISYLRFDLSGLPASTPFHRVVIEEAALNLFATSMGLAGPERRFLVTARACAETGWEEDTLTWNTQPCPAEATGEDSTIIANRDLPLAHAWDVSRALEDANTADAGAITFTLFAIPLLDCARDPLEGRGCESAIEASDRIGMVRFASRDRAAFGIGAVPHLVVRHTTEPTLLLSTIQLVLSLMSAFALSFSVYKAAQKLLGGGTGGTRDDED